MVRVSQTPKSSVPGRVAQRTVKLAGRTSVEESNSAASRLRKHLPVLLGNIRWGRVTSRHRDDLLRFLPAALAQEAEALGVRQAQVVGTLKGAGGALSYAALREHLAAAGLNRVAIWQTLQALVAGGRIVIEDDDCVRDEGGSRSEVR